MTTNARHHSLNGERRVQAWASAAGVTKCFLAPVLLVTALGARASTSLCSSDHAASGHALNIDGGGGMPVFERGDDVAGGSDYGADRGALPPLARRDGPGRPSCHATEPGRAASLFALELPTHLWLKWGCEYPVSYIFEVVAGEARSDVSRCNGWTDEWNSIPVREASEVFNGVEAVRYDGTRILVTVGFADAPVIHLRFHAADVRFHGIAEYYDDRLAAYTLSDDNWGRLPSAHPGIPCISMTDDGCDKYQAAVLAASSFGLPLSIAVNTESYGASPDLWAIMQSALDEADNAWEPAVHTAHHPCDGEAYDQFGYESEILGCRDSLLETLTGIPYGQYIFESIPPCGYIDATIELVSSGEFLFLRDWNYWDHPDRATWEPWNDTYDYYGPGGFQTASYDTLLESRSPKGLYHEADAQHLNDAFDAVLEAGGIFYAMWHSDRYENSVIHSTEPLVDGVSGSTLMAHWEHVANRPDVWYVANGWLYAYKLVADQVEVMALEPNGHRDE